MIRSDTLVVGGRGFIGTHLLKVLNGADVIDLKDGNDFLDAPITHYKHIVFLVADMGKTLKAHNYNLSLFHQLAEWIATYPSTHVIYTSSAAVYPDLDESMKETDELQPVNLYGEAKLSGEKTVEEVAHHTILRLSNVYGQGGHGVIDNFKNGGYIIYGDGEQVRDYVDVSQVVKVVESALDNPALWQGVTNVSSGQGWTTNEVFSLFGLRTALRARSRPGDMHHSVLDNSLMRERLKNAED